MRKSPFAASCYYLLCRIIFSFYCKIRVKGAENLPTAPYILCSNHCSHLDTPVLMLAVKAPFSQFGMVAAKDYFFGSGKKWLSAFMNLLPVDRKPTREALENHINLCRRFCQEKRGMLIFYPEGTRSMTGELQKFKKGAAQYAYSLAVPIIPVYIRGTYEALPKGKSFIRPKTIHVRFGSPIYAQESGLSVLRKITEKLQSTILALKEQNNAIHG